VLRGINLFVIIPVVTQLDARGKLGEVLVAMETTRITTAQIQEKRSSSLIGLINTNEVRESRVFVKA
jgi:hypothetical protein